MSWLDPIILWFKNGLQLPVHRRVALGDHLTMVEDAANDQLILDGLPPPEGSAPKVVTVSGADHSFNGDGSSGATKIFPQTILFVHVDGTTATFDFGATAVTEGTTVFFSVEGANGHVTVRNNAGEEPVPIMLIHTAQAPQMQGIYFDGDDWVSLNSGNGLDNGVKLVELTRALGGDNFHGLEFTQWNGTGIGGSEFPTGTVGVLAPVTIMHVDLSPDGGGSTYRPTIGFGVDGVLPGFIVHVIVTRGGSSTNLYLLNGSGAGDPIVTLNPADYFADSSHYRIHSIIYTGTGAQNAGRGWQRLTPYGDPALV